MNAARIRVSFCAVRRAAAWTEHRHQRFAGFAAYRSICLYRSKASRRGVAFVALLTFVALFTGCALFTGRARFTGRAFIAGRTLLARRALRPLRSLRASLTLGAGDALNALGALRSGRTLRTRLTLRTRRSGILAASGKRKRKTNDEYRNDSHVVPLMIDFQLCTQLATRQPRHGRRATSGFAPSMISAGEDGRKTEPEFSLFQV
jgi:hypothetical protein